MINWEIWKRNSYLKLGACFAFIAIVILAGRGVATQVDHAPINQKLGALAIITATRSPTKLVNTLPRNIRQAARRRGSRRSKTANSTDFKTTAIASTRIEPDSASAGTMTCINGTTGSHANAGFAAKTETPTSRSIESLGLSTGTPSPQRSPSDTWLFRRCSSS